MIQVNAPVMRELKRLGLTAMPDITVGRQMRSAGKVANMAQPSPKGTVVQDIDDRDVIEIEKPDAVKTETISEAISQSATTDEAVSASQITVSEESNAVESKVCSCCKHKGELIEVKPTISNKIKTTSNKALADLNQIVSKAANEMSKTIKKMGESILQSAKKCNDPKVKAAMLQMAKYIITNALFIAKDIVIYVLANSVMSGTLPKGFDFLKHLSLGKVKSPAKTATASQTFSAASQPAANVKSATNIQSVASVKPVANVKPASNSGTRRYPQPKYYRTVGHK